MPIKKVKSKMKASIKKPRAKPKPRAAPKPRANEISKAYKAGLLAGMPAYGSIPRTGGNYSVGQLLPPQVFASSASVPIGSNVNEKLIDAYNALVWQKNLPSKEEFENLPINTQQAYIEAVNKMLGKEALIAFKEKMGTEKAQPFSALFQSPSQKGGLDFPMAKTFSNIMSEVINTEITDDPTTNSVFSGSSFTNRPSRFPQQTSDVFDLNQIEKQDNALSNLSAQTKADAEDIQVSNTLEEQAYYESDLPRITRANIPMGRKKLIIAEGPFEVVGEIQKKVGKPRGPYKKKEKVEIINL